MNQCNEGMWSPMVCKFAAVSIDRLEKELTASDPVFELVFRGDLKGVRSRLEGLERDFILAVKDKAGWSLVHYAVLLGHTHLVDFFMRQGLDPDLPCTSKSSGLRAWRPIHLACEVGRVDVITQLLHFGANPELFVEKIKAKQDGSRSSSLSSQKSDKPRHDRWSAMHLAVLSGVKEAVAALLSARVYPDPRTVRRKTPLMLAAKAGLAEIVKMLLDAGAQVNAKSEGTGKTPLFYATVKGNAEVVQQLLAAGADPYRRCLNTGLTPVMGACLSVDCPLDTLTTLVDAAPETLEWTASLLADPVLSQVLMGVSALVLAFIQAKIVPEKFTFLVERGANINCTFDMGSIKNMNMLQYMIQSRTLASDTFLLYYILDKGINIDHVDSDSYTALMAATQNNLVSVVNCLVDKGADPNHADPNGCTALMLAVKSRSVLLVQAILTLKPTLETGISFTDKRGNRYFNCTPLQMAVGKGVKDLVEILLDAGANINAAMDANGPDQEECCVACLHTAVVMNYVDLGRYLMERGLSPDVITSTSLTPLDFAASWGHLDFAKLLIDSGAAVDPSPSVNRVTPLIYAAKRNKSDVIRLLLKNKANPNRRDKQGLTALHWALNFDHNESIEALIDYAIEHNPQLTHVQDNAYGPPDKPTDYAPLDVNIASGKVEHRLGVTPLVLALEYCRPRVVEFLLNLGADPNVEFTANGMTLTPIFLCSEFDSVPKMELLINAGADINRQSSQGETPLHFAIRFKRQLAAELLVRSGASLEARATVGNGEMLQAIHVAAQLGQDKLVQLMFDYGACLNSTMILKSVERVTPLHLAALNDFTGSVATLLELGCEVNCTRSDTFTPLLTLVSKSNVDAVREMLKYGADVNCRCVVSRSKDATCLHIAAQVGCREVVELLVDHGAELMARMTTGDRTGILPIHLAAESGHLDVIRFFLSRGVDVNVMEDCGLTCLHYAANTGKTELVEFLIKAGADVSWKANFDDGSRQDLIPIHMAAEKGHTNALRLLLAHGSPVDAPIIRNSREGITALYLSVSENRPSCVKALVEAGANVNLQDSIGAAPLHIATQRGYEEIFYTLISPGRANVNVATANGVTPLHMVAEKGHIDMAFWLLRMGAHVDPKCQIKDLLTQRLSTDITPLNQACGFGHVEIVRLLVKSGANMYSGENFEGEENVVSIHCAAIRGRTAVLSELVEAGIHINIRDTSRHTALHWAVKEGFYDFVAALLHYGANPLLVDNDNQKPSDFATTNDIRSLLVKAEKECSAQSPSWPKVKISS